MLKKTFFISSSCFLFLCGYAQNRSSIKLLNTKSTDARIEIEAENFDSQQFTKHKAWYITSSKKTKKIKPDPDKKHLKGASNNAYIEVLPETFHGKDRKMIEGINFSKTPGKVAIVDYKINFQTTGKFYIWVKGYCSSTLDNSIHAGINNKWNSNGNAIYFCKQNEWMWSSTLRDKSDNCYTSTKRAYINVYRTGTQTIQFSMREDGFEFDKFILTKDRNYKPN